jgi:NAD(P)-dependent dehydrogenase (short-subunit alcohol dehydrogenase family)
VSTMEREDPFVLTGRCAVVAGCSRGNGAAISVGLARTGADVAGMYRRDADGARQVMERVGSYGHGKTVPRYDAGGLALIARSQPARLILWLP